MQTQFQLCSNIHANTNETHSLSMSTRLNPYFGWFVLLILMPAKVGITSCSCRNKVTLLQLKLKHFHVCMGNFNKLKFCQPASLGALQPAVRPSFPRYMMPDFYTTKVIILYIQSWCSNERLSFPFILHFIFKSLKGK